MDVAREGSPFDEEEGPEVPEGPVPAGPEAEQVPAGPQAERGQEAPGRVENTDWAVQMDRDIAEVMNAPPASELDPGAQQTDGGEDSPSYGPFDGVQATHSGLSILASGWYVRGRRLSV